MTAQHTPGPWHAESTASSDFVTRRIYATNSLEQTIAVADVGVPGRSKLEPLEEVANTHLIAAAPDMLAALGLIKRYAETALDNTHGALSTQDMREARETFVRVVDGAIAKAKGGAP